MEMGSDRMIGLIILAVLFWVGLAVLAGIAISTTAAGIFLGLSLVAFIFYIGLIAAIYDTDPICWTKDKVNQFLTKEKGDG